MTAARPLPHARALTADELREAFAERRFAGPQNLYLRNQLALELRRLAGDPAARVTGDYHGSFDADGLRAIALFARVGVLVVAGGAAADGEAIAQVALGVGAGFRLVIAEREPGLELLARIAARTRITMNRSQPFLVFERGGPVPIVDDQVRLARDSDLDWLVRANLELNREDLGIAPNTVHRRLLEQRIQERMRDAQSWVLEIKSKPVSKLELGSRGPAGTLIEGVFTSRKARGRGHAQHLVAQVCHHRIAPEVVVGLHCNRENLPALRAYEAVGFREVADLRLACLQW